MRGMHWFYAISFNNKFSNLFFKWSVISIFTIFVISREIALHIPLFISGIIHEVRVRIRGLEMLVFRKILCTYLMDGSSF